MRSKTYTVIVRGRLGERFASAFPGVSMEHGFSQTRIDTEPLDQSQLDGLLDRLRNLAIELVSVQETSLAGPECQPPGPPPDATFDRPPSSDGGENLPPRSLGSGGHAS
jgi:hypothetical protein